MNHSLSNRSGSHYHNRRSRGVPGPIPNFPLPHDSLGSDSSLVEAETDFAFRDWFALFALSTSLEVFYLSDYANISGAHSPGIQELCTRLWSVTLVSCNALSAETGLSYSASGGGTACYYAVLGWI